MKLHLIFVFQKILLFKDNKIFNNNISQGQQVGSAGEGTYG